MKIEDVVAKLQELEDTGASVKMVGYLKLTEQY